MLDLEPLLHQLGVQQIRVGHKEISGTCIAHARRTGAPQRRPHWSINRTTGAFLCFSCGWTGGIRHLYQEAGQQPPDDLEIDLATTSVKGSLERQLAKIAPEPEPVYTQTAPLKVDIPWLLSFPPVPKQLLDIRHIRPESAEMFDVRWDTDGMQWVIPIKSPVGELMGVQYRHKGAIDLNYPEGVEKSTTLFGFDYWSRYDLSCIAVIESPLDVVRCHTAGMPAVGSFGAHVSDEQIALLARHFRYVVSALDNPAFDQAGRNGTQRLINELSRKSVPVVPFRYDLLGNAKDPGDVASHDALWAAWSASKNPFPKEH